MKAVYLVASIFFYLSTVSAAVDPAFLSKFESGEYANNGRLLYRLHKPAAAASQKVPLVLYLHGAGKRGGDNEQQLTMAAVTKLMASQDKYPHYLLVPQCARFTELMEVADNKNTDAWIDFSQYRYSADLGNWKKVSFPVGKLYEGKKEFLTIVIQVASNDGAAFGDLHIKNVRIAEGSKIETVSPLQFTSSSISPYPNAMGSEPGSDRSSTFSSMKWDVTDNGAALSVTTQPVGAEGYFGIKIPVANVNLTSSTVLSCEMKITQKNKVYMTTIGFDNDNHLFYSRWCSYDWEKDWSAPYPAQPMPQMRLTIELMQKLISSLPNVDTKRIYVGGQSMGGFGTWEIVTRQSNMFACAAPSAGGGDKSQAAVIKNLPIWCAHSANDPIVKSRWTTQMVDALKQAESTVKLTLFDGNDHMCDDEFWTNELVDWFFSHNNPGYAVSTNRALNVSRVNTAGMRSEDALFDLLGRVHMSSNVIKKLEYAPKITLLIDTQGNKTLVGR